MARTSKLLLGSTVGQINVTGDKVQAAAFFNNTSALHTIAVYTQDLDGRISIQATLATHPKDDDWFTVQIDPNSMTDYVEYSATTGIFTFSFTGNYVWVRAVLDRSYLSNPSNPHGYINKILLNY